MATDAVAGPNAVLEALRAGSHVVRILVARGRTDPRVREIEALARERKLRLEPANEARLTALYHGKHQGIVALVEASPETTLDEVLEAARQKKQDPFLVALDHVQDPQNLGAILRSAEAAGVHGVIIPDRGAAGVSPAVHKASAGASQRVPVVRVPNFAQALRELRRREIWIIGADPEGERPYDQEKLTGPIVFVLGSEGDGMKRLSKELCDRRVSIPMRAAIASLNVSAAAAILLFERVRQTSVGLGGKATPKPY